MRCVCLGLQQNNLYCWEYWRKRVGKYCLKPFIRRGFTEPPRSKLMWFTAHLIRGGSTMLTLYRYLSECHFVSTCTKMEWRVSPRDMFMLLHPVEQIHRYTQNHPSPTSNIPSDIGDDSGQCTDCYPSWGCRPSRRGLQGQVSAYKQRNVSLAIICWHESIGPTFFHYGYVHVFTFLMLLSIGMKVRLGRARLSRVMSQIWGEHLMTPSCSSCIWRTISSFWQRNWSTWRRTMQR